MKTSFIGRNMRRSNRNLLVVNLLLLVALWLWAICSARYLYNCFWGPFTVTYADLTRIAHPDSLRRYFVRLDRMEPFYAYRTDNSLSRSVKKRRYELSITKGDSTYFAQRFEKLIVIVKSSSASPARTCDAALVPLPASVRVWFEYAVPDVQKRDFESALLPYLLDASDFRRDAVLALMIFAPISICAAWNVTKALRRIASLENSPIYRQLQLFNAEPVRTASSIDHELANDGDASPIPTVYLTQSWLLCRRFFGLDIIRLSEVVWIYQTVNYLLSSSPYSLYVADERGRRILVAVEAIRKDHLARLMHMIIRRVPWAATDYSSEINRLYSKDPSTFVSNFNQQRRGRRMSEPRSTL